MTNFIESLNHSGDHFLNFAWPMLWQSSLLIAIIFVLDFALRRKIRAAVRHVLWFVVLVKLLLPPSLALPTSPGWWIHPSSPPPAKAPPVSITVTYGDQTMPDFSPAPAPVVPPKQPALAPAAWAMILSGIVSAGLFVWPAVRWRVVALKIRDASDADKLDDWLNETARLAGLHPAVQLKLTEDSISPAVCGLFRPVILLPQSLVEKLSTGQLRAVLLHEVIHLRRGDVWVNCAQALLQIVYWWHPLLWLANARIRRLREEAVDDAVMLALRDDAEIYAPTLLEVAKLAFNRPLASLGLVGILESRSALRQRIERLINFNAPRKAGLTLVSILGILVFSAVALPMGEAPEKTNEPTVSALNLTNTANTSDSVFTTNTSVNTVTGILSDTNFRTAIRALEQRTKVESLAEPEPVTTAGRGANRINQIDVPDKINISTVTTNAVESDKLVQDGKLLYEMGKFDDAEAKLKAALALNPDNQGAFYYLSLVQQADFAREEHNRTNQAANSIEEVAKAWSPKQQSPIIIHPNGKGSENDFDASSTMTFKISQAMNEARLKQTLLDAGVKIPPTVYFYDTNSSILLVRGTKEQLALVYQVVLKLNGVSPQQAEKVVNDFVKEKTAMTGVNPVATNLEMRVFKVDPHSFPFNLRAVYDLKTNNVVAVAGSLFNKLGVDLTAPGRSIAFNDKLGLLFVKATAAELDTIELVVQALNQINPQIHIKARFIEVPKDGFEMPQLYTNAVAGPMTGILSDSEFRAVLQVLEHQKGVVMLAEPECVTTSGRQTQMRATDIEDVLTNYALNETSSVPAIVPQIGKLEIGPTVDIVPYVLADGYTVNLTAEPQLLEFLGYVKSPDTRQVTNKFGAKILLPAVLPHFRAQKAEAHVNLWDNQTLVLGNLKSNFVGGDGQIQNESKLLRDAEKKNGTADKELLVFITATIVDPAGNRVHSDDDLPFNPSTIPVQPKIPNPSP